jgi:multiple sugar transport system substrate-binding protein
VDGPSAWEDDMAHRRTLVGLLIVGLLLSGCGPGGGGGGDGEDGGETIANGQTGPITYVTGKDTAGWVAPTLKKWTDAHPNEQVTLIELPESANDQRAQMVANLQAKSDRYSILYTDVVWTAEFAKSGWLEEIPTDQVPEFQGFAAGPKTSCEFEGKAWCVPAASDGGMLYYRKDILDKEGAQPPTSWEELAQQAKTIAPKHGLDGYFGQHAQYEGLTVNASEAIWAAGGEILTNNGTEIVVNSPEATAGLGFLEQGFKEGWIPKAAVTFKEEEARRRFQSGKALFMRQWPYAYALMEKDKNVRGKFDVAPLPGPSALGGHNHAISKFTKNKKTAFEFIRFVSTEEQQLFRLGYSIAPTSKELYSNPEFLAKFPYLETLGKSVDSAKNRPITPYYNDVTLAIQESVYPMQQGQKAADQAAADLGNALKEATQS